MFIKALKFEAINTKMEIELYNQLINRFGISNNQHVLKFISQALLNKSIAYKELGNFKQSINTYEKLINQFKSSSNIEINEHVAKGMYNLATNYLEIKKTAKTIKIYQDLISKFASNKSSSITAVVARTRFALGIVYFETGQNNLAIDTYHQLINKYKDNNDPSIEIIICISTINISNLLYAEQLWRKSYTSYKKANNYIANKNIIEKNIFISTTLLGMQLSQHVENKTKEIKSASIKLIKEATKKSNSEERMHIALGIAALFPIEKALTMIQEGQNSKALWPLVVALKQLNGEDVRTSVEVMEIAEDVKIRIKEMRKTLLYDK